MTVQPPSPCSLRECLADLDPRLLRCGFDAAPAGRDVEGIDRRMEMFDLWHVASGTGSVRVSGCWHDFGPDDLVSLFPGDVYEAERASATEPYRATFAYLHLSPTRDAQLARDLRPLWPRVLSLRRQPAVRGWFRQLFEWSVDPGVATARHAAIRGTCWLILDAIATELDTAAQPPVSDAMNERLHKTRAYLDANLAEPLQLADIAAVAALSVSALEANFRRAYGLPPIAYLLRRRMEAAQVLLAQGLKPKAVCAETGFRSLQYFSRFFRAQVGVSPRAFAKANVRHPGAVG